MPRSHDGHCKDRKEESTRAKCEAARVFVWFDEINAVLRAGHEIKRTTKLWALLLRAHKKRRHLWEEAVPPLSRPAQGGGEGLQFPVRQKPLFFFNEDTGRKVVPSLVQADPKEEERAA